MLFQPNLDFFFFFLFFFFFFMEFEKLFKCFTICGHDDHWMLVPNRIVLN